MFKLLVFACLLAFAFAAPKPSVGFYGSYAPAGATYTAYSNYAPYAAGYYGSGYGAYPYGAYPYGAYPYSGLYY